MKLLKCIIRKQVISLLVSNNLLNPSQHGFRENHSCLSFGILLHKLKSMGITGKLGIWQYHFLVNYTQFESIPGGSTSDCQVISGVPRGTVLGPLLFLILVSDIDEGITNYKIISFANDTRLYNSVSEVEDCDLLQVDLDTIYK